MLGKLFGGGDGTRRKKDKAIIHKSVPEEVLFPNGRRNSESDTSWMDDVFEEKKSGAKAEPPAPEARTAAPAAAPAPGPAPAAPRAAATPVAPIVATGNAPLSFPDSAPNARTEGRPRFPVGWLVTVEGEGVGNWAPLEAGVSTLGGAPDATIALGTGGAAIAFDPDSNAFSVSATAAQNVRVNGSPVSGPSRLRDGDVIGFGGTAMKLVALCNGNFRWSDADKAG